LLTGFLAAPAALRTLLGLSALARDLAALSRMLDFGFFAFESFLLSLVLSSATLNSPKIIVSI
jgi:hypothetical protein